MSQWAADELVGLDLGDHRLNERLVKMVEAFSARPEASVPQASGNWAATKGAYRFWDSDQVSAAAILAPHLQASIGRAGGQPRVLVVQDTTDLDFTAHPSTQGIGPLDNQWVKGLKVHSALLVSLGCRWGWCIKRCGCAKVGWGFTGGNARRPRRNRSAG